MPGKAEYEQILEKQPLILWALTGRTNGHMAEVLAAVGSRPKRARVFSWPGEGWMHVHEEGSPIYRCGIHQALTAPDSKSGV